MKLIITLDLIKMLNCYLLGCFVAITSWLIIKTKYYIYLKKKYKNGEIKSIWKKVYINKDILYVLLGWFLSILCLYGIVEGILDKMNRKYYKSYKYRRFKDILLFRKKIITINNYFEMVLKRNIKGISIKKLVYRIKKGDIVIDRYNDDYWENIKKEITINNIKDFLYLDDISYLESLYKDLIKDRFISRYNK